MTTDDEAVRSTGLLSGLLATHEGEHHVVNNVVRRSCPDHRTDRPGQGQLVGRLTEFLADAGSPAVQHLIIGRGHLDHDPAALSAGLPARRWGENPWETGRIAGYRPSLLRVLQSGQAAWERPVPARTASVTAA